MQRVSQIRMTAGKLANLECTCFVRKMTVQEGFELDYIQLFARSNGCWIVQKIAHRKSPLAVSEHCGIVEMGVDIERTERKTVGGVKEFTPRRIPRHPAHLQCAFRRKSQSTLHCNSDGTTGSKNRNPFTASAGGEKLRQTGIHS